VDLLRDLYHRTADLAERDEKLESLKALLAGDLKGRKVLIFSTYKDTARYVERRLIGPECADWRKEAGAPRIRRLDSGNHPDERTAVLGLFAPVANKQEVANADGIDILISTDVLSEGQNLQDCGAIVNYDLTWNPIRLVQRNGRIDRLGSPHSEIDIYNMFPEDELEQLLHLVQRLTERISQIDDLGLLDASVLGEIVHPRTFNVLRRLRDGDTAILDDEEQRAELAGPELLLKQLKELLNREETDRLSELPNGIHSGLRREKCYGMFFYFQAPRSDGEGKRHFWRYIDARTHEVVENRYEIAQTIACHPDEPRYIGDQDVFVLQQKVIDRILSADREVEAKAVAANAVDPIQQSVTEEIKDAIRRNAVDRSVAKRCIGFLGQPMGASLHKKLRAANEAWKQARDDAALLQEVAALADEFSKVRPTAENGKILRPTDLELICFEYVTA
jgi:SNF2 family DNA or RNA helicase